jgi:hypothetical protein
MDESKRGSPKSGMAGGTNFLVSIHYTENHSWQGTVQWLDTGHKVHFRSELELLSLMSSAVQSVQDADKGLRCWGDGNGLSLVK